MASSLSFRHDALILDADCVINLYASGRMREVLSSIPCLVATSSYVREVEARRIYAGPDDDVTQRDEPIGLEPLIRGGILHIASLETDDEVASFVDYSVALGAGEATTGAIALHRAWAIATDDGKARRKFRRRAPQLQLISTPELVKHWVDTSEPERSVVSRALLSIQLRGGYQPYRAGTLSPWWRQYLEDK